MNDVAMNAVPSASSSAASPPSGLAPATDAAVPAFLKDLGVPGIVDLHVHFMPASVQRKVWAVFDALPERGLPAWPVNYRFEDEQRVRILRELGVSAYGTLNYAHRPGMAAWLNEYSRAFAAEHPDAIHSATFYPEAEADASVAEALAAGARLFKVHVQVGAFSPVDPLLEPVWRRIAAAGTPVVIHCGSGPRPGEFTGPEPIARLVERHPDLVLVIAHAGMPEYREFAALACTQPNVYLDTTMVGTDYMQGLVPTPEDFPELMRRAAGKVVFGSDFPTIPYGYHHQLQALSSWGLGEDWLRDVLWRTPARLVGLS
jgi:uncharacterized protein